MKIRDEIKLQILKDSLEKIEKNHNSGICSAIESACVECISPSGITLLSLDIIEELRLYEPEIHEAGVYWFRLDEEGKQKRIKILKDLIRKYEIKLDNTTFNEFLNKLKKILN